MKMGPLAHIEEVDQEENWKKKKDYYWHDVMGVVDKADMVLIISKIE